MNTINRQKLIDVYSFVNCTLPGAMICASFQFVESNPETVLLIKESPAKLAAFPRNNMHIEFRTGLVKLNNVCLVPLLVKVDHNSDLTYETWLNYHHSEEIKQIFESVTVQDYIHIFFYDQRIEPAMAVSIENNLHLGFRMHIQYIRNTVSWTAKDFKQAKDLYSRRHPAPLSLWHDLKETARSRV